MSLPSFVLKTGTSIHTVTNLEVVRELVFDIDESENLHFESVANRKEYLRNHGFLDNSLYTPNEDFTQVFTYLLITNTSKGVVEILNLRGLDHGKALLNAIWSVISDPHAPKYVDLTQLDKSINN